MTANIDVHFKGPANKPFRYPGLEQLIIARAAKQSIHEPASKYAPAAKFPLAALLVEPACTNIPSEAIRNIQIIRVLERNAFLSAIAATPKNGRAMTRALTNIVQATRKERKSHETRPPKTMPNANAVINALTPIRNTLPPVRLNERD